VLLTIVSSKDSGSEQKDANPYIKKPDARPVFKKQLQTKKQFNARADAADRSRC
jgi:hypothetical protein